MVIAMLKEKERTKKVQKLLPPDAVVKGPNKEVPVQKLPQDCAN